MLKQSESKSLEEFNSRAARLLCAAPTGSEALRKLINLRKALGFPVSVAAIARQSGFGSRANLHNLLAGRRTLSAQGAKVLAAHFRLEPFNKALLVALAQSEGKAPKAKKAEAEKKVALLKRLLRQNRFRLNSQVRPEDYLFFIIMKTSFDLFPGGPSLQDLLTLFGTSSARKIALAIQWGLKEGLLTERNGRYFYKFRFSSTAYSNPGKVKQVLRETLLSAMRALEGHSFGSKDAYFRSSILSVNKEAYRKKLEKLVLKVREFEASLDSSEANQLVQLGVQVFPLISRN